MTRAALQQEYAQLREHALIPLAERIEGYLKQIFRETPRIDRIAARAKAVDRFVDKALREEDGHLKYSDPMQQIQDQIGCRVVVFYLGDVVAAAEVVNRYFRPIEARALVPESESEFGYFGKHYVCLIPTDVYDESIPDGTGPKFFELQIKTLFQHAWSEAEHDLAYKPLSELSSMQKRKTAFTAAQAWGADLIFDELHRELLEAN